MSSYPRIVVSFLAFRRIPLRVVLGTAVASYLLQMGMVVMGQPLYIIALFTLLPWIPVILFEGLWKIRHYHWLAIFGVVVLLQFGHMMEHIVQVGTLVFTDATLACPPPVDTAASAERAVEAGVRSPLSAPTGLSASVIVVPGPDGQAVRDAAGDPVSGPPACGIFGQLDQEIVHLLWEAVGWVLVLVLLTQLPRNGWLWMAMVVASWHTVEHVVISYTYFLDPALAYASSRQIWATLASGSIVTAFPLGLEPAAVNFYNVAGKFGILAKNGLVGQLIPALNDLLPTRPFLHFYYNALFTIPIVIGLAKEMRRTYDQYLKRALPRLRTRELVAATLDLERVAYKPGDIILRQGDFADAFYILTDGEAEVVETRAGGGEVPVATLRAGQYFGEIGLLDGGRRLATVRARGRVEVMRLSRQAFCDLIEQSALSRQEIEALMAQRRSALNAAAELAPDPA